MTIQNQIRYISATALAINVVLTVVMVILINPSSDGVQQWGIALGHTDKGEFISRSILMTLVLMPAAIYDFPPDVMILISYLCIFVFILLSSTKVFGETRGMLLTALIMFWPWVLRTHVMYLSTAIEVTCVYGIMLFLYASRNDKRWVGGVWIFYSFLYLSRSNISAPVIVIGMFGILAVILMIDGKMLFTPYNLTFLSVPAFLIIRGTSTALVGDFEYSDLAMAIFMQAIPMLLLISFIPIFIKYRVKRKWEEVAFLMIAFGLALVSLYYSGRLALRLNLGIFGMIGASLRYLSLSYVAFCFYTIAYEIRAVRTTRQFDSAIKKGGIGISIAMGILVSFWLGIISFIGTLFADKAPPLLAVLMALILLSPTLLLPNEYVNEEVDAWKVVDFIDDLPDDSRIGIISYRGSILSPQFITDTTGKYAEWYYENSSYDYVVIHMQPKCRLNWHVPLGENYDHYIHIANFTYHSMSVRTTLYENLRTIIFWGFSTQERVYTPRNPMIVVKWTDESQVM